MTASVGDPLEAARTHFAGTDEAYLVGGRVRDALLGRHTVDTDLAVAADALRHARAIAARFDGALVVLDAGRDVARVVWADAVLDIARFAAPTLEEDLKRRDLTINAIAVPVHVALPPAEAACLDPTRGREDLAAGVVRMTSPGAFDRDPLRLLRAVRIAIDLGFAIEDATRGAIRDRASAAALPAAERVRDELLRMLGSPSAVHAVAELESLRLLAAILPEVAACRTVAQQAPHDRDVLAHTLEVLGHVVSIRQSAAGSRAEGLPAPMADLVRARAAGLQRHFSRDVGPTSRWTALRLAALLHDVGKAGSGRAEGEGGSRYPGHAGLGAEMVDGIAARLRLSGEERRYVGTVVLGHPRPLALARSGADRRNVYRYFQALGEAGVDVAVLSLADNAAKPAAEAERVATVAATVRVLFDAWFDRREETVAPVPLVSGRDLMTALAMPPGPALGRVLEALREAQACGEVSNRDEALALAAQLRDAPA